MGERYDALTAHLREINNVDRVMSVLDWDQNVLMPPKGVGPRADQMATLSRIHHEMLTSDQTGKLIDAAADEVAGADADSDPARMVEVARYDYESATKLPTDFVAKRAELTSQSMEVWAEARKNDDFAAFAPMLEQLMEMSRQEADYRGYEDHPYDALLNQYERGMTAAQVKTIFDGHKPDLVSLIERVGAVSDRVSDAVLRQSYPEDKQRDFALWVVKALGFDFQRGRQDVAVHPFATNFSRDDVRITTRFHTDFLNPALFGMMHEAGHGMYEQGAGENLAGTILESGTSLGVHESQSRLWENIVGRSRGFWSWAFPKLQQTFPAQLGEVELDAFYKAINKIEPSLIRVEADEATYNLHIMLRFDLELALLSGDLKVADLPAAWNETFRSYLGFTPPNDAQGVLQDIHWSVGLIGYFPTYALGNLLSVQYYNEAIKAHPEIPNQIAQGKFDTLLGWLRDNIYQHGRKFTSVELTERITGGAMDAAPYMAYLNAKYRDVYGL